MTIHNAEEVIGKKDLLYRLRRIAQRNVTMRLRVLVRP